MSAVEPMSFLVNELKEALRERSIATSGSKTELIQGLTEFDPDVWEELRRKREEAEVARIAAEEEAREEAERLMVM